MATSGTIVQGKDNYGVLLVTITNVSTAGANTPFFLSQGYPFGSAEVVVNSGTTPTNVALQGSNDGVNWITLGSPATAFPAISALSVAALDAPAYYYRFLLSGGDSTTNITITCILMGTRG